MLTEYIKAAMQRARYEILPNGEGFFGKIDGFQGVWANSDTLEGCREELQEVLEEWLLIGFKRGSPIEDIGMSLLTRILKEADIDKAMWAAF